MAGKKMPQEAATKKEQKEIPSITARIDRLVDYENTRIKAVASANIGGAFAIHGIKVIDSQKGLFVQMPQSSYEKDGKTEYRDLFHPITAEARTELNNTILEVYEAQLAEREVQEAGSRMEGDQPAFGQPM